MPTPAWFITFSFLLRIVEGVGTAMYSTASYTLLTQMYSEKKGTLVVSMNIRKYLPYSRKYWRALNSAVWSQTNCKICLSKSVVVSYLSYLNKAVSSQEVKRAACQRRASYIYSRIQPTRGALGRAKSATACITSLQIVHKIILADFNLVVSTLTSKLLNLISVKFSAIWYQSSYTNTTLHHF